MSLSINIILIIVSCSCVKHVIMSESSSDEGGIEFGWQEIETLQLNKRAPKDCKVKIPPLDNYGYTPVPFGGNFSEVDHIIYHSFRDLKPLPSNPKLVRPNEKGYVIFKHNATYKLTCTKEKFIEPPSIISDEPLSEITITCFDGSFELEGKKYKFTDFKCIRIPLAKLVATESSCQYNKSNEIFKIGFQSSDYFVDLFRICFDTKKKSALYTWHFINTPMYKFTQNSQSRPKFISTGEYHPIDPAEVYKGQKHNMKNDTKINYLETLYDHSKKFKRFFVVPAHLTSDLEFSYVSERHATYFYENTAPQWFTFNRDIWIEVQRAFRRHLIRSTSKHLIVTGTYTAKALNNSSTHKDYQLFVSPGDRIPVPDYFWKLDYDYDKEKNSAVYIAMNNPYKRINYNIEICEPIRCPGRSLQHIVSKSKLFYCCTKEAFEKAYGVIDPIVFKEF